jgi:hypothetical protein
MRALAFLFLLFGCDPPTQVSMSFLRKASLYDAPFPSDDLRRSDGTIVTDQLPNPDSIDLINQGFRLLKNRKGFSTTAGIYFRLSRAIDEKQLPDLATTMSPSSPVFLVAVDDGASDLGTRRAVNVAFYADGGPFGSANMLSLVPLQGAPLLPNATYAAVVTKKIVDVKGQALDTSPELEQLIAGKQPAGMSADTFATYHRALTALAKKISLSEIAALSVFTTGDPSAELGLVRDDMLSRPPPSPSPFALTANQYPSYCTYESVLYMPDYQSGQSPFQTDGGEWQFDDSGKPILQKMSATRLLVTIPDGPMPPNGWPVVVVVQIGMGGDYPITDRGTSLGDDFSGPIVPGSGPALYFAQEGFAGVQLDSSVGGLRNPSGDSGVESINFFNFMNAAALRDNVRETAAELTLLPHLLPDMHPPACAGGATVKLDTSHIAIMGHSNGAWVAPIAAAYEAMYGALILSGAGASYIANIMDKQKPLKVRPLAEIVLNYNAIQRDLTPNDPGLMLVQWGAEPSDPQVYNSRVRGRNVLMIQGIVDHYILPSIANATSLSMGLDLGGMPLDATNAEEQMLHMTSISTLLPLVGGKQLTLPVTGNAANGAATALVVQHNGDGIEDGHEVAFQTDAPKHQYKCFLQSWLAGVPTVVPDGAVDAPCN